MPKLRRNSRVSVYDFVEPFRKNVFRANNVISSMETVPKAVSDTQMIYEIIRQDLQIFTKKLIRLRF